VAEASVEVQVGAAGFVLEADQGVGAGARKR
jgi:hypothetical protein